MPTKRANVLRSALMMIRDRECGPKEAQLLAFEHLMKELERLGCEVQLIGGYAGMPSGIIANTLQNKSEARVTAGQLGSLYEEIAPTGVCTCDSIQYGDQNKGEVKLDLLGPGGSIAISLHYWKTPPEGDAEGDELLWTTK